jgi:hypothetical protein
MDHLKLGLYALAALGAAGALRVIPLVLEDLKSAFERSLDIVASVIQKYRSWRAELWPTRPASRR